MKKPLSFLVAIVILVSATYLFSGCNGNSSSTQETTVATEEATQATTQAQTQDTSSLKIDERIIGTWQMTNEDGTQSTLFSYIFENDGVVTLAMDNVGYSAKYAIGSDDNGKATLTAQLYYGLNGTYTYELSEDKKTLTLAGQGQDNTETIIMKKVDDYNFMPEPPKNPEIDQKLLGTWEKKADGGETYTFDDKGIMVCNSYDMMTIYSQYSAKDGKIDLKYKQGTEVEDEYSYSFGGDILTIDGVEYIKATES